MKKYAIGYTQGAFDMFHIGHLNLLKNAKEQCEKLIVGVNSDDLVYKYKNKRTVISESDRVEIVKAIRYVDDAMLVDTLDKLKIWDVVNFNAIFIGDDWKGSERWRNTESVLADKDAEVVYLKYTQGVNSTILRGETEKSVSDNKE